MTYFIIFFDSVSFVEIFTKYNYKVIDCEFVLQFNK